MESSSMIKKKIIIIDDDKALSKSVKSIFDKNDFITILSFNTDDGYKSILKSSPDIVVLDINMPSISGLEFTKILRKNPMTKNIPIIMLTGENTEDSKVDGLEKGADDYVTKPFSPKELLARVNSLLRRVRRREPSVKKLEHDGLLMSLSARTVTLDKKPIFLRPKEFDLLYILMSRPNTVVNREFILESIFEYDKGVTTRTIDTHIKNLRSTLGHWAKHIETVFGSGFKFVPSSK
jgi:DNA-binding response OmpR family regulator